MKWPSKSSLSAKSGSRSDVSSGAFSAQVSRLDAAVVDFNILCEELQVTGGGKASADPQGLCFIILPG